MRNIIWLILFSPFFGFTQKFDVKPSKTELLIGEPTVLKLSFKAPADYKYDSVYFDINETEKGLGNNWEIWRKSAISKKTIEDENGNYITTFIQEIELANFDTGKYELPPFIASANQKKFYSDPILLSIKHQETNDSDELKPLKPIKEIKITWFDYLKLFIINYWLWILIAVILILFVLLLIRYWINKPNKIVEEKKVPVSITLLEKLKTLDEKKYWQNGKYKKFYSDLSEILWIFLEDRYEISTFEKTSDEILNSLKWKNISKEIHQNIHHFFTVSDEVKFAKIIPLQKDNVESFKMIKNLIENERNDIEDLHLKQEKNNV